jgi:hypothetical protein
MASSNAKRMTREWNGFAASASAWAAAATTAKKCWIAAMLSIRTLRMAPNDLRFDVAEGVNVQTSVHCAATSIQVEPSRFKKRAWLFAI